MNENNIYLKVQLNQIKYTEEDCKFLYSENLDDYNPNITLNHWPSAIGWDTIFIILGIGKVIEIVTEAFLSELGTDLYNWSKSKLSKITADKEDFDESRINIIFSNCNINIYCNSKEDLLYATENIKEILIRAINDRENHENEIDIDVENFKDEKKSNIS